MANVSKELLNEDVPKVVLKRFELSAEGTFGRISYNGFSCFSGELQWNNNKQNVSCIPKGVYFCTWTYSERLKRMTYLVNSIPNRGGIRIHPANFVGDDSKGFKKQVDGCIALGQKLGVMDGQKALLLSRPAVRQFEDVMQRRQFMLEIL